MMAYYDNRDAFLELCDMEQRYQLASLEFALQQKPDFIFIGASGAITLQSPEIFRELSLPTLREMTRTAKQADIPTLMHCCGKEWDLLEIVTAETDLSCINPLEVPPQGDCDLAEVKETFGDRIALMGNLHTTSLMLFGSPEEVYKAACKAIDAAGADGGLILSTGDQCPRDTPEANIFAMCA